MSGESALIVTLVIMVLGFLIITAWIATSSKLDNMNRHKERVERLIEALLNVISNDSTKLVDIITMIDELKDKVGMIDLNSSTECSKSDGGQQMGTCNKDDNTKYCANCGQPRDILDRCIPFMEGTCKEGHSAWISKQLDVEVGDEIAYVYAGSPVKGIVVQVVKTEDPDDEGYKVLCSNGCGQMIFKKPYKPTKTGVHYNQIAELFEALRSGKHPSPSTWEDYVSTGEILNH